MIFNLRKTFILSILLAFNAGLHAQQYIHQVHEYMPAPGQQINKPTGIPQAAQSIVGGINGMVSLGAFGGYLVFSFETPVQNHPDHPYGIDFILFGNPLPDWSEPGIVWVMKDENNNGLPDDTWYELAGSDYFFSTTRRNFQVSYFNPGGATAANVPWTDNLGESGFIYANAFNTQPYYPLAENFPNIPQQSYTLTGTYLGHPLNGSQSESIKSYERGFGYADNKKRGTAPFNIPDNPYTAITENGGGDGMDISWAVDSDGNYVELDVIHFVKVQTGMLADGGWLGEVSTEITGAVKVQPNVSITGELNMVALADIPRTLDTCRWQLEALAFYKGRLQANANIEWSVDVPWAEVDANKVLKLYGTGVLTVKAALTANPAVFASQLVNVVAACPPLSLVWEEELKIGVFPSPVSDYFAVRSRQMGEARLYHLNGSLLAAFPLDEGETRYDMIAQPAGVYVLVVNAGGTSRHFKIIKH